MVSLIIIFVSKKPTVSIVKMHKSHVECVTIENTVSVLRGPHPPKYYNRSCSTRNSVLVDNLIAKKYLAY